MALIKCRECNESVSTEAVACPHSGAPQQRPAPPPLPVQSQEYRIYLDDVVAVTTSRVVIGGTTYALGNITSVKMTYTPRKVLGAFLLLLFGLLLLLVGYTSIHTKTPGPDRYLHYWRRNGDWRHSFDGYGQNFISRQSLKRDRVNFMR
jgi:hypothetical protein